MGKNPSVLRHSEKIVRFGGGLSLSKCILNIDVYLSLRGAASSLGHRILWPSRFSLEV